MLQSDPDLDEKDLTELTESGSILLQTLLADLVIQAVRFPLGSQERQKLLTQMTLKMQQSGKIWRGGGTIDPEGYSEALQRTWLWFCRSLEQYDAQKASVLVWFNSYLRYRILDVHETRRQQVQRFTTLPDCGEDGETPSRNRIDQLPAPDDIPPILERVQDWLEQQRQVLMTVHLRDRPDVNAWILLRHRLPSENLSWQEMSQSFGVPIPTLSNFYQNKCLPRLITFGQAEGWLEEDPKRQKKAKKRKK